MPKPYIIARPSGLFARYLVPVDLRAVVGSRFIVRALHARGDRARLAAAAMAVALSQAFEALRAGQPMGEELLRKALAALQGGKVQEWEVVGANGQRIQGADTPDPAADFARMKEAAAWLDSIGAMRPPAPPPTPVVAAPEPPARPVLTLKDATARHLGDLRAKNVKPRTLMDSEHTLRLMAGILGEEIPVAEIDADKIREVRDGISHWPKNASKREAFRNLSVRGAILKAKVLDEPGPEPRTMEKHAQRLSKFFNDLFKQGQIPRNPLHGVEFAPKTGNEDSGGRPFDEGELGKIFEPVRFRSWAKKYPHRWFGPMLGLYSGARVSEVGQLLADDIEQVENVWGFHVREAAQERQSVKNRASLRFVPIAQAILDAGLLDYIADLKAHGHRRLFPNLPNKKDGGFGAELSKQFSAYLKTKCGIDEHGLGFHGFRHYVASALSRQGLDLVAIAPITGHALPGGVLPGTYIHKNIGDRAAAVAKLAPPVALPTYTRGQFQGAFHQAPKDKPPSRATKKKAATKRAAKAEPGG